jgi:7-cyano-7-deazaguanine reductase
MSEKIKLGQSQLYPSKYDTSLLERILRKSYRENAKIDHKAPFGFDLWNAYEFSCLDATGKPLVSILKLIVPSKSKYIVESKSFKYYLNSFNMKKFTSLDEATNLILKDLNSLLEIDCDCLMLSPQEWGSYDPTFSGVCLDTQAIYPSTVKNGDLYLKQLSNTIVSETYYSHHFRSLCPVTGQPDWASIEISYEGKEPDLRSIYNYIVSFRSHQGFHEQCVEKIYSDIVSAYNPKECSVIAFFLRRGGIDICPVRSSNEDKKSIKRTFRQ